MAMSPAPNVKHQSISRNLLLSVGNHLRGKRCKVFDAPFDVRLYDRKKSLKANREIYTIVQTDLCVICNPELLDTQGCNGAPDWIIEILSKGNSKKEMTIKYELYAEAGVLEYWIVYPEQEAIHQFVLNEQGHYDLKMMFAEGTAQSHLFPDLEIELNEIFEL